MYKLYNTNVKLNFILSKNKQKLLLLKIYDIVIAQHTIVYYKYNTFYLK